MCALLRWNLAHNHELVLDLWHVEWQYLLHDVLVFLQTWYWVISWQGPTFLLLAGAPPLPSGSSDSSAFCIPFVFKDLLAAQHPFWLMEAVMVLPTTVPPFCLELSLLVLNLRHYKVGSGVHHPRHCLRTSDG